MITSLPLIFGIASFLLGCSLLFVSSGIFNHKESQKNQKKSNKKILFVRVISIVLITKGGYDLFSLNSDIYKKKSAKLKKEWSETAKDSLKKYCIYELGKMSEEYVKINQDYCDCKSKKIMETYTQAEYEEIIKKHFYENLEIPSDFTEDCLPELQRRYDSIEKQRK